MTIKTKYLFLLAFCLILGFIFLGYTLGTKKKDNQFSSEKTRLNNEILRYKAIVNGDSLYIASVEQEIMDKNEAIKQGEIERKELKALNIKTVNELTKAKLTINILLDSISNNGTVIIIKDTVLVNNDKKAILLPFTFKKSDQWYYLAGGFDLDGVMSAKIGVNVDLDLYGAYKKKDKVPSFIITTTNPYVTINSLKSIKFDTPKPKRFGIGLIGGYGINIQGNVKAQPFIGLGLSYSILRF
jgi:hypothetical protein